MMCFYAVHFSKIPSYYVASWEHFVTELLCVRVRAFTGGHIMQGGTRLQGGLLVVRK